MSTISASTTSTTAFKITTDTTGALVFQTGASPTTAATLDASGNLLLNTTSLSTYKANLNGTVGIYGGNGLFLQNSLNDAASAIYNGGSTGVSQIQFNTSSTERMRLDASGNLGLGVTPSAWGSSYKALEFLGNSFIGNTGGGTQFELGLNFYRNSSGQYIYKTTAAASYYEQYAGTHVWYNAASGTAGNTISFTQAMTLDASGRLGVGLTTISEKLDVYQAARISYAGGSEYRVRITDTDGNGRIFVDGNATALIFGTSSSGAGNTATERARIDASGRFAVGTTNITGGGFNPTIVAKSFADSIGGGIVVEGSGADSTLSMGYDGTSMFLSSSYRTTAGYKPIALYTSGVERVRVDTSGRVTKPYQVGFSAYGPATGTGQYNIVIYGATRYNQGSNYSTSSGVFTAPIAGRYFFTFNSLMNVNGDYVRLYFRVNGVANATYGDTLCGGTTTAWAGWSYMSIGMSIVLDLAQNDTVAVWNDGPSTTYGTAYGTFSGYLLG